MKSQKHILFISSWYPNRNNPTHGIFNLYFAKAAALYNQVSVIHVCSDENIAKDFEIVSDECENIKTITVYYKKVNNSFPFFSQLKKRANFLQAFDLAFETLTKTEMQPQLIQLNVVLPAGIGVMHLSKKHQIPFVVNENWSGYTKEDGNYKGFLTKYFTQKIIARAKKIMPTSTYLKEAMLSNGLNGDYEVVPNVVDVKKFIPLNLKQEGKIKFIHISSLVEREKNVSGIIKSFSEAFKINSNIELNIIGEGENKESLQKLTHDLNMSDRVFFKGRVTGEDLVKLINEAIALIMFSHYETFCLVNIETFACGKPVITSNAGAIPSYMNRDLGIMIEKNNQDQLREAILNLASNPNQFESNKIRNFAEKFSYENIGLQLNEIYESVIKKN